MAVKQYENRDSIESKYKWNLEELLLGKTPEQWIEEIIQDSKYFLEVKESKYESKENYLEYLKKDEELSLKLNRFSNYISNSYSLNVVDPKINEIKQKFEFELYRFFSELGSEDARFFKNTQKFREWKELPEFATFKRHFEHKLEEEDHKLPEELANFRIKESRGDVNVNEIFSILTNSELDFGNITTSTGEVIELNPTSYRTLLKHDEKDVRKQAIIQFSNAYLKHKNSLSNLLYQHKKQESVHYKLRNFNSSVEGLTFGDRVTPELVETLYTAVQNGKDIFKKYSDYRKKFYEAKFGEKHTQFDNGVELVKLSKEVTIEQAIDDVIESVKPFGAEYTDVVTRALKEENWVDYLPVKNKRGGAYSIGSTYGLDKKYILLNFDGTLNSVSTLTHEIGHSLHSYFSCKHNALVNSSYRIFVAEVASIFNELLLSDYYLNTIDDKEQRFYIYESIIKGFAGTVVRQIEWSNYEYDFYKAIDAGIPVSSWDALVDLYKNNNAKYRVELPEEETERNYIGAIYVPHFYYGFYVYKYAIGQLVACIFFNKYKTEGPEVLQKFISEFLSAGCRQEPLEILKSAGIDLLDPSVSLKGFAFVQEYIDKYVELGKEIFGVSE